MDHSPLKRLLRQSIGLSLVAILVLSFSSIQTFSPRILAVEAAPLYQTTPTISFSSLTYSVLESAATANITVQISAAPATTATVEYLTLSGTATPGSDYVETSGTLTFNSSGTQSFSVSVIDDSVDEPDETVRLILRNPVNATLGTPNTATLTILDNDVAPTNTPTATTGAPPVYVDDYEPNNTFQEAYSTASDANPLCSITLWPSGDIDFFRFTGKSGSAYEVLTTSVSPGLDTQLTVYNPQLEEIGSNDDAEPVTRASRVTITADSNGFYYARIINKDPSDPATKTYCFEVNELQPPTPPPPFPTGTDQCEFNSLFEFACEIGEGETKSLNFVPSLGSDQDTDIFRLWVKPGIQYTCETHDLAPVTDTNIILFDLNTNPFNPAIGNDDKAPGDYGSRVTYLSSYTGWLYIMVGPANPPALEEAPAHTYQLTCTATAATATPTASPTFTPRPPGSGGFPATATSAAPLPTPLPTITPIDFSFLTVTPIPPPVIQFQPLPTSTPFAGSQQSATIDITLYYDSNFNFMPELTEGIVDVAVALYDNATGQLIAFGYTNEAGMIRFDTTTASGALRIAVPFLNYSQVVVGGSSTVLLRVAPQPLPIGIP
jgi:hypothetical protein